MRDHVNCRIGSLEIVMAVFLSVLFVNCRIGSLEIVGNVFHVK